MSHFDIAVVGAGLAGLCSAHYLAEAGFTVLVLEAEAEVGQGASFANGGLLTPSMSEPWNAPGVQWDLLRWLGRKDAPMLLKPTALWHYIGWGLRFIRHANPKDYAASIKANFALSLYSLEQTQALSQRLDLQFDAAQNGSLKIWRDPAGLETGIAAAESLVADGLQYQRLSAAQVVEQEPLLAATEKALAGGILYASDSSGNALKFCQALRHSLEQRGVTFRMVSRVAGIVQENGQLTGLRCAGESLAVSRAVIAAGALSGPLMGGVGVNCPVRPVKGYSLSVRLTDQSLMPKRPIIDDALHAAVSPLGDEIRVAGTAEFSGWNQTLDPARVQNLWDLMRAISADMADAVEPDSVRPWCGLRPMSADGRALIGPTRIAGLYLNAGHGHLGWSQAVGSGQLLAAAVSGEPAPIDGSAFAANRYSIS